MAGKLSILGFILGLSVVFFSWPGARPAQASCGAVTCFVVIGSQQQVPIAGLLTVNAIYGYTPMRLLDGTNGVIPGIDQANRQMILDHHQETRTITQQATLDLNYGITERIGLQLTLPYMWRSHHHIDGLGEDGGGTGESTNFSANGAGDIRVGLKYNVLPTLSSMVVLGFGVFLPSGNTHAQDNVGGIMESTSQLGRGSVGLNPTIYQTYELIPHRLNQFTSVGYRHQFRNNDGYQFGDQWDLNGGFNIVTVPWLVLTTQLNYRYMVHDNFSSSLFRSATPADGPALFPGEPIPIDQTIKNRPVPTTGSTFLAFTPGFQLSLAQMVDSPWTNMTSMYFYSSIPVMRDSNNSLAQSTSYIFGLTRSFQLL